MIIKALLVNEKGGKMRFFEKTFLLANTSLNIVFRIFFVILSNTNIQFLE